MIGYLVLKWDARREATGKHGKFDNIWMGPFQIISVHKNNTYEISHLKGDVLGAPISRRFLKHFLQC
jgi:hypothetical protein